MRIRNAARKILIVVSASLLVVLAGSALLMLGWNEFLASVLHLPELNFGASVKIWAGLLIIRASLGGFLGSGKKNE